MNIEFFIHGVPKGQDFWGAEDEQAYFSTIYDNSNDEVKFLIQMRTFGNKTFCYYHYLVYKNIVDNDGRSGSYFGISLRLDAYCNDVVNLYRILDIVYNAYIVGSLVKTEGNKVKYAISNFASASNRIESIKKTTFSMMQEVFSGNSFGKLNNIVIQDGGKLFKYNLYDCTQESILAAIKMSGKIVISPYWPSKREMSLQQEYNTIQQQCNAKIQAIQQQWDIRLKDIAEASTKEINESKSTLSLIRNQKTQLENDLKQKETTIERLNSKLKAIEQNKNISQIVSQIEKPVLQLADAFRQIVPNFSDSKKSKIDETENLNNISRNNSFQKYSPIINIFLSIIIICILLCPFKSKTENTIQKAAANIESQNASSAECSSDTIQPTTHKKHNVDGTIGNSTKEQQSTTEKGGKSNVR